MFRSNPTVSKGVSRHTYCCHTRVRKKIMKKENLFFLLVDSKICSVDEIKGASLHQIEELERTAGKKLPKEYCEFLLAVGNGAGNFLRGTDIFLPNLDGIKEEAEKLLRENAEEVELTPETFVFSMHQSYEFTYFDFLEGDNPPIYQYVEGNGPPVLTWGSFDNYLNDVIGQHFRSLR